MGPAVKLHSGGRKRPFGKCRAPGARRFNPTAAMTPGVMSAPASAAGRRSVAGLPRTAAVEFQLQATVEIDPRRRRFRFTHRGRHDRAPTSPHGVDS